MTAPHPKSDLAVNPHYAEKFFTPLSIPLPPQRLFVTVMLLMAAKETFT
jgi:hypothetical protein